MRSMFPTWNSYLIQATPARIDRSIELLWVNSNENKSLESTHIRVPICMSYNSEYAWAMHFVSSIASPAVKTFAAETDLTGPFNFCESQDVHWKTGLLANAPTNNPYKIRSCPLMSPSRHQQSQEERVQTLICYPVCGSLSWFQISYIFVKSFFAQWRA